MKNRLFKIVSIIMVLSVIVACTSVLCACNKKDEAKKDVCFDKTTKYCFDTDDMAVVDNDLIMGVIFGMAINEEKSYIEFKPDGTFHCQLTTIDGLLGTVADLADLFEIDLDTALAGLAETDLEDAVDNYVVGLFPGFTLQDLEGSLNIIYKSLGLTFRGIDFTDEGISSLLNILKTTGKLPANLLDYLPEDLVLQLVWDGKYKIVDVTTHDGKAMKAIYIGNKVAANDDTQPFAVMTIGKDADDEDHPNVEQLKLRVEVVGLTVAFNKVA